MSEALLGVRGGGRGAPQKEQFALLPQQLRDAPPSLRALRASQRVVNYRESLHDLPGAAETFNELSKQYG